MNSDSVILEARGIQLRRGGRTTLAVPHLAVMAGEVLALVGPNGAGKTTLLLTLAGLLQPGAGTILFKGRELASRAAALAYRRSIAVVFQESLLLATTVYHNVAMGLKLRGVPAREIKRTVPLMLSRFRIADLADRSGRSLSGGEAQRASLARAFVLNPRIVFLDEPFASLDPPTREALLQDLAGAIAETRTTVVFATHHQDEALRLADRMAVMRGGAVVQIGRCEDVMNSPRDEFVASFVGMETVLWGTVLEAAQGTVTLSVAGRQVAAVGEAAPGEELLVGVRPENVTLSAAPHTEATSARNVFPATVVGIVPKGFFYKVALDCGFPLAAYVTGRSVEMLGIRQGARVAASFKATAVHVIRKKP